MRDTTNHQNRSPRNAEDADAPRLGGVFETALYTQDLDAVDDFYGRILGLKKIFSVPKRQLVFECEKGFLLIFDPRQTEKDQIQINGGAIPLHGARGAGHMAFSAAKSQLESWRRRLSEAGVPIESEVTWPNGAHSIYFRDPAGNSVELATPDMWSNLPVQS